MHPKIFCRKKFPFFTHTLFLFLTASPASPRSAERRTEKNRRTQKCSKRSIPLSKPLPTYKRCKRSRRLSQPVNAVEEVRRSQKKSPSLPTLVSIFVFYGNVRVSLKRFEAATVFHSPLNVKQGTLSFFFALLFPHPHRHQCLSFLFFKLL